MLMITSDARIAELIKKGRKERSDALFLALNWVLAAVRPKSSAARQKGAAVKQCCPS